MPLFKVKVKWGKELYDNIEVNSDEEPILFKAQLFALTGVEPERQKVLVKGTTLKEDWENIKLSDGLTILMMGSRGDLPTAPITKQLFMEDMDERELQAVMKLPGGLHNLGNTCYLNATVQCLRTVPELSTALEKYEVAADGKNEETNSSEVYSKRVTKCMSNLFRIMSHGVDIAPSQLLQALQDAIPRFSERVMGADVYAQQDANECWIELLRLMQHSLPPLSKTNDSPTKKLKHAFKSMIDEYFMIKLESTLKCEEDAEESVSKTNEDLLQLSCFISPDVKYMINGLKNKMEEKITKYSEALGRDATYVKTLKISRLPAYLTVQFVRFSYKLKDNLSAKILRDVKFPITFDAYDLCSTQLQEKLMPMRDLFQKENNERVTEALDKKEKNSKPIVSAHQSWFDDDPGSNNSGYYTLRAVLTHKGRTSGTGHYVAWVRNILKPDSWIKCDDDTISPVLEEDVLKLSGGGDWHVAYVLLYGPKM